MQIYLTGRDEEDAKLKELSLDATAVALGQFDAMHIGHIEILKRVVDYARAKNIKSLVYMFENDPREVIFGKKAENINSLEKRFEIINSVGIDMVIARKFDREYMDITFTDFAEKYLFDKFKAKFVAVGYNYRFGKGGAGDTNELKKLCADNGVEVSIVPEVRLDGEQVSSTVIRDKISNGKVAEASRMMGRCFSIKGVVTEGNKIGKKIGFPTANMEFPSDAIIPKYGVYKSLTHIDGRIYNSMTNVGGKPTVDAESLLIETHIDAEVGELYGREIEIELCEYIREIVKFESLDSLKIQLKKDKEYIINS